MTVVVRREERQASLYQPNGREHRFAAALIEKGWVVPLCEKWNSEDALIQIRIPKDKTDAQLVADIEAAFPGEDFDMGIEDHWYGGD